MVWLFQSNGSPTFWLNKIKSFTVKGFKAESWRMVKFTMTTNCPAYCDVRGGKEKIKAV
jgi:hypothetical protein